MSADKFGSIDAGVRIGHVHLKVADLNRSLGFYCGVLGFELMQRLGNRSKSRAHRPVTTQGLCRPQRENKRLNSPGFFGLSRPAGGASSSSISGCGPSGAP